MLNCSNRSISRIMLIVSISALATISANAANLTVDCSGQTPGAFTSLQAAIDSLDLVGPHEITVASQPCTENFNIANRQRIHIVAPTFANVFSANGFGGDVLHVSGSTNITITFLGFLNGNRGVVVENASQVRFEGCEVSFNAAAGLRVTDNSTVTFVGEVQQNGGAGIRVDDSSVLVAHSQIFNNGASGVALRRSHGVLDGSPGPNEIHHNLAGVNLLEGASAEMNGPNLIQFNTVLGMQVGNGASVSTFGDNRFEGNVSVGISIFGGQALLTDGTTVANNGAGQSLDAGIRVDDNGSLITSGSAGDIQVVNNHGPGIDATTGGDVDLTGTLVSNNAGDGIRAAANAHVVFFPPNTNTLAGNTGKAINCDASSVFFGDKTGLQSLACPVSPAPGGARSKAKLTTKDD